VLIRTFSSERVSTLQPSGLGDLLLMSWCRLPQDTFRGLLESMPQWVRAVLEAYGGLTAF